ncbi:hypothetical protein [Rhodophyticola sp.]|jgi:hypothetical protein|uniref:hypothetical protein n=1 Tax=Rhodophyticola sp. TaxID=2680032 RepID=UPI001B0E9ACC|nr:hypothetical protein [Roseicyclus sp.]MBO6924285.1 hypothetical protein [Roseicyclus sp.]
MKTYLTTTAVALALATSPALANSSQTDIDQILDGVQEALNSIYAYGGGTDIDQTATNAGNIISRGSESLDDIFQDVDPMSQLAENYLEDGPGGGWTDVNQAATNVLNSLSMDGADSLEDVTQKVDDTAQIASNSILFDADSAELVQAAVNAANIVSADGVELDNNAYQRIDDTYQEAINNAVGDDGHDDLDDITQAATNVGNSITMGDVDDIRQKVTDSDQFAENFINIEDDLRAEAFDLNTQDAVNALNLASIVNGDTVRQKVDDVSQIARNYIDGASSGDNIEEVAQAATNVANSLSLSPEDTSGLELNVLLQEIDDMEQVAYNEIDYGADISDISQAATNAANIAAFQDIEESVDQFYFDSYQSAENVVFYGSYTAQVADLTQAATNVINSLSGDSIENGSGGWDLLQYTNMFGYGEMQYAGNYVSFGDGGLVNLEQAATNAANLVSVEELRGTSRQFAISLDQISQNVAEPGYWAWGGDVVGQVDVTEQSATNAANILTAVELPDLSGTTDIVQVSVWGDQFAANSLDTFGGNVSNFAQSAVNVANSISLPSAP